MKCGFVGREHELDALQRLTNKLTASMMVVTGRRRIGKSRLIEEFAERNKRYRHVAISGLAPQRGITPAVQRSAFANQMQRELSLPPVRHDDWLDLFAHLARATQDSRAIVLLDEVSWMGKDDPEFLPKLKLAWDRYFKENANLILVLCGSVSSWLEKNILSNTGCPPESTAPNTVSQTDNLLLQSRYRQSVERLPRNIILGRCFRKPGKQKHKPNLKPVLI